MKKQVTIDLPDNFEKGDCGNCPFYYEEMIDIDDDGYMELDIIPHCIFEYSLDECKLDVVNVIGIEEEI